MFFFFFFFPPSFYRWEKPLRGDHLRPLESRSELQIRLIKLGGDGQKRSGVSGGRGVRDHLSTTRAKQNETTL